MRILTLEYYDPQYVAIGLPFILANISLSHTLNALVPIGYVVISLNVGNRLLSLGLIVILFISSANTL